MQKLEHRPSGEALFELIEDAERIITLYRGRPETLRPSAVARELNSLAIYLNKAAKAAETLGQQGLLLISAMSGASAEASELDMRRHILYLQRMASWSRKAAEVADQHSRSARPQRREDAQSEPERIKALRAVGAGGL